MKFESSSIDDIIEHILTRLNTDYAGCCLDVPDFCQKDGDYDRILEMRVRDKMYKHDVAFRCSGTGQPDTAIELTAKGAEVYENGGWKKYLVEYEKLKKENEIKATFKQDITITGSVYGSNIGHGDFSQSRIDFKDQPPTKPISQPTKKSGSSSEIWDKIKHISGIVGGIGAIVAALTKLMDLW